MRSDAGEEKWNWKYKCECVKKQRAQGAGQHRGEKKKEKNSERHILLSRLPWSVTAVTGVSRMTCNHLHCSLSLSSRLFEQWHLCLLLTVFIWVFLCSCFHCQLHGDRCCLCKCIFPHLSPMVNVFFTVLLLLLLPLRFFFFSPFTLSRYLFSQAVCVLCLYTWIGMRRMILRLTCLWPSKWRKEQWWQVETIRTGKRQHRKTKADTRIVVIFFFFSLSFFLYTHTCTHLYWSIHHRLPIHVLLVSHSRK